MVDYLELQHPERISRRRRPIPSSRAHPLLMADETQPLPLQAQCLLYLGFHLEAFPPEALALLPARLRIQLLRGLPAIDVCQLERTAVGVGIDMNACVWEYIFKDRSTTFPSLTVLNDLAVDPNGRLDYRDNYVGNIASATLHGNSFLAKQCSDNNPTMDAILQARLLLLGLPPLFEPAGLGHHISYIPSPSFPEVCNWVIPQRYASLLPARSRSVAPYSEFALMKLLMLKCHYFPDRVYIDSGLFCASSMGDVIHMLRPSVFKAFLSKLRYLGIEFSTRYKDLSYMYYTADYGSKITNVPKYVLETVFATEKPQLKSLALTGPSKFISSCLPHISPFLSQTLKPVGQATSSRGGNVEYPKTPYAGLRSVSVSMNDEETISEYTHFCLESIVQHQSALTEVNLHSYDIHHTTAYMEVHLLTTLASLFKQEQFRRLHLEKTTVTHSILDTLVSTFLTAPCSGLQTLNFVDVVFDTTTFFRTKPTTFSALTPPCGASKYKSLAFRKIRSIIPLFQWLSALPFIALHTLEFTSIPTTLEGTDRVLSALASIPALQVANLILASMSIETSPSAQSLQAWETIVGNPYLRTLNLTNSHFPAQSLIYGLRKQAFVGGLEKLTLSTADSAPLPPEVSEAILALPKFVELILIKNAAPLSY